MDNFIIDRNTYRSRIPIVIKEIGNAMKKASLCGLGQTAPNPVLSTMKFFKEEYGKINIYGGDGINTFRVPDTATTVLTNLIKDGKRL